MFNVYYGGSRPEHIIGQAKTIKGAIRLGKINRIMSDSMKKAGFSIGACALDEEIHGRSGFSVFVGMTVNN